MPSDGPVPATEEPSSKKIALDFFAALGSGDGARAFALLGNDATWRIEGSLDFSGDFARTELPELFQRIGARMPQPLALEIKGVTAEGERVAIEAESLGTRDGRTYNNRYHYLVIVRDGLVRHVREYMDTQHAAWFFAT